MGRCILLSLLLFSSLSQAAFEQVARGARAISMSGTTVSVEGDFWACYSNPSCLGFVDGINLSAEYLPGVFGMPEIKRGALAASCTLPAGTFALSMSGLGFELYHEMRVGIAAARQLNDRVVVGFGLGLYSLAIRGYGSDMAVGLDIGALLRIVPGISYGVVFRNVNRPAIGDDQETLPQSLSMGVSVHPLPGALVAVCMEKDSRYPFEMSVGVEYCLEDLVALRFGAAHEPSTVAAGIGVRTSLLSMDYAYTMHPDLGGTHSVSLSVFIPWP
jgi:hypothetical protein